MGQGRRRSARRICLTIAALCVGLYVAAPALAQTDDEAVRPDVFRGAATSLVASVEADRAALLPVPEIFRFIALDGVSVYETDLQTARASLFFPGNGLILGPNLACGTFGGQFPEQFAPILDTCTRYDYPLSVTANVSDPDRATTGTLSLGAPGDAVSAVALGAKATANPDESTTIAAMEDLRVLGIPGFGPIQLLPVEQLELDTSVLTVASASSHTDQRIDERGVLVVDAESVMSGVRLVGGLIEIGSIRSHSTVTADAAGERTSDASFEVGGVTVAGVPAQITENGLVVGDPEGGSGPIQQQLETAVNQLVEALGVEVTLLAVEETVDDGTGAARAGAGGLLVEIETNVDGLPTIPGPLGELDLNGTYVGSVQLGATGATAGAADFSFDFETGGDGVVGGFADTGFDPGSGSFGDGSTDFGDLPAAGPAVDTGTPGTGSTDDETAGPAPDTRRVVRSVTDKFGGRLGFLYLAFMFTVLGLCVVPGLSLPARLPGARP